MNKKNILAVLLILSGLFVSEFATAQKYWIKFKNKTGTPFTIGNPSAYLSSKSIGRRAMHGIGIDSTDLPVTPSYVSQVDAVSGVTILSRSKWMNGVVVQVTNTVALTTINSFSFVQSSNPVNKYKVVYPVIEKSQINSSQQNSAKNANMPGYKYGGALNQAQMIGADCMHNAGYRGQGITISVMDAGFTNVNNDDIFDSLYLQGRMKGVYDFVDNDYGVYSEHTHGAMVLSTMAACYPDSIIGTAPKADYWLFRTEDGATETPSEEYNWIRAIEYADSLGTDIATTSLGYTKFDNSVYDHTYSQLNGKTSLMSKAATMATRKGIIVLNAAGNEGGCGSPSPTCWYYISVPADADSIITVGAVDASKTKAGFSSFGPTSDGRVKPDLCAQGQAAYVCFGGCFPGNGTSFATPVLAGATACLLQAKPFATPMLLTQAMKASATNSAIPNNSIGWGVPNMCVARLSSLLSVHEKGNADAMNLSVFPNPFSNSLTIRFNEFTPEKPSIIVRDVLGKVVLTKNITITTNEIVLNEFDGLKQGLYFITVSSGNINVVKKIVKQ